MKVTPLFEAAILVFTALSISQAAPATELGRYAAREYLVSFTVQRL